MNRRHFLRTAAIAAAAPMFARAQAAAAPLFRLSLAQWSLHRALFSGKLDNLDFPAYAKKVGVEGVEYVNIFFKDRARDQAYLTELKKRCTDNGIQSVLIMCDREGDVGDPDEKKRAEAVENHLRWIEAAKFLGCHSIRVNARSSGSPEEQHKLVVDGLSRLGEAAKPHDIGVIVENHGGLSSDGAWLAGTLKAVGMESVGSLPDFGNFHDYDRYQGIEDLMPYAKGVSAKSHEFDAAGNETKTDYERAMRLVLQAGYRGFVGIEYEGSGKSEDDGIIATRDLLIKLKEKLAGEFK
ncbi:MAG: sugar phosphate isomerase/epimerase family protein [Verrucomicrobiales bacterium]